MGDKPVTAISGIGSRTAARLGVHGVLTVAELAAADHHELARSFGPAIGPYLRVLGVGGDDARVVDEPHVPRSRSREVTFEHDLTDPDEIATNVIRLAEEVTASVADLGRRITHVAVKVRTATFFTRTKIRQAPRADDRPGSGHREGARGARPLRGWPPDTTPRCPRGAGRPTGLTDDSASQTRIAQMS